MVSIGVVSANQAGFFTINISNGAGQINTNINNSTIQSSTNMTNSNATENVTLTNSTLNLNVNGQNITLSTQPTPSPTPIPTPTPSPTPTTTPTPTPTAPTVEVTYAGMNEGSNLYEQSFIDYLIYNNLTGTTGFQSICYNFTLTITPSNAVNPNAQNCLLFYLNCAESGSSMYGNTVFCDSGTTNNPLNQALQPLLTKYSLLPYIINEFDGESVGEPVTGTLTTIPFWFITYNGNDTFTFTLYGNGNNNLLTTQQTSSLTQDLQTALTTALNSS